jgi:hypothetical protein
MQQRSRTVSGKAALRIDKIAQKQSPSTRNTRKPLYYKGKRCNRENRPLLQEILNYTPFYYDF